MKENIKIEYIYRFAFFVLILAIKEIIQFLMRNCHKVFKSFKRF